jgi:predicted amidohydrolase
MKIAGISYDLEEAPETLEKWFDHVNHLILNALKNQNQIVVLPELMHMSLAKYCKEKDLQAQIGESDLHKLADKALRQLKASLRGNDISLNN